MHELRVWAFSVLSYLMAFAFAVLSAWIALLAPCMASIMACRLSALLFYPIIFVSSLHDPKLCWHGFLSWSYSPPLYFLHLEQCHVLSRYRKSQMIECFPLKCMHHSWQWAAHIQSKPLSFSTLLPQQIFSSHWLFSVVKQKYFCFSFCFICIGIPNLFLYPLEGKGQSGNTCPLRINPSEHNISGGSSLAIFFLGVQDDVGQCGAMCL